MRKYLNVDEDFYPYVTNRQKAKHARSSGIFCYDCEGSAGIHKYGERTCKGCNINREIARYNKGKYSKCKDSI